MTVSEEIEELQALHARQGFLVIGSVIPLQRGPIDPRVCSTDEAYRQARWRVIGESSRVEFEQQAQLVFGRRSGLPNLRYFYRVSALD